jgi:hypothetical protein
MALEKFTWQNGTQIELAKVEIGGQSYNVSDAQYEGETPLSATNLNLMQDTLLGNVKDDLTDDTKIPSVKAVKEVYSTTEKIIGTWINGKPIYRKVIDTTYSGEINTNIQNLDTMVKMDVLAKQPSTNDWRNLPWLYGSGSTYGDASWAGGFYFIYASSKLKFQLGNSLDDISKLVIILEYTKTTD